MSNEIFEWFLKGKIGLGGFEGGGVRIVEKKFVDIFELVKKARGIEDKA